MVGIHDMLFQRNLIDFECHLGSSVTQMSKTAKLTWLLYNITNVTTLIITFIYWGFVHNPGINK